MNSQTPLKLAIRKLIHSSQVKPEAVQVIIEGLENENITPEYWENLFNKEGADIAVKQKVYSPQLVRLMTLRAIVIPETLPQFLAWLNIQPNKKPDENQIVSLEFQSQISGYVKEQIIYGIKFLLIELLKEQITPDILAWLFQLKGSICNACYQDLVSIIKDDVNLIVKAKNKYKDLYLLKLKPQIWNTLINNLVNIQSARINDLRYYCSYYYPLGKLFELLQEYKLAAYFYQVSCGEVPKNILSKISLDPQTYKYRDSGIIIYGLYITRKATKIELMSMQMIELMIYIKHGIIYWSREIFNLLKFLILGIIAITITIIQWIFQVLLFLLCVSFGLAALGFVFQNFGAFAIISIIYLLFSGANKE